MMKHELTLKFDDSFNPHLYSTQTDSGREFDVEVRDELDKPVDIAGYKLEFYVGNSHQVTKVEAENVGNKFIVRPEPIQFAYAGPNEAQFVLYDPKGLRVGSQIFDLQVEKSIQNGATMGLNAIVDFEEIKKASQLLKNYEATFEQSKAIDLSLRESTEKGTKLNEELKVTTADAETKKKLLDESVGKAETTKSNLDTSIDTGQKLKMNLDASISTATQTKTNIDQSISNAGASKTNLDGSIDTAKQVKTDLDGSIGTGRTVKSTLDKTIETGQNVNTSGMQIKQGLDDSISKANTGKTNLDTIIKTANETDVKLKETIDQANTKDGELKSTTSTAETTDTQAKATVETLKALLSKSDLTEKSLKEIIETGDLTKYVTDSKLREELAKIELKQVKADILPQTGEAQTLYFVKNPKGKDSNNYLEYLWIDGKFELIGSTQVDLTGYVKTPDLDPYAKNVYVDKKIANVNLAIADKVSKKDGWGLSENNYSSTDKAKVDAIPANPKYTDTTYDLTPYAKTTDLTAYAKKTDLTPYAKSTDIKTKLSELTDDSTHRLVTDSEKSTWNGKLSSVYGQDISRAKTKGYNTSNTWQSLSSNRDLEDWIGDFDKRTRENKSKVDDIQAMTTSEVEAIFNEVFK